MSATYSSAPDLPGILPVPKERGRIAGFIYRHPTIAVGGFLVVRRMLAMYKKKAPAPKKEGAA